MLLFVYGTLKRTFCRHSWLAGETFLGKARTASRYRMFNVGSYPALVETPGGIPILGEIWNVSCETLTRLDDVEGVDEGLYERRKIELESEEFEAVEAYFYLLPIAGLPDCGENWTLSSDDESSSPDDQNS